MKEFTIKGYMSELQASRYVTEDVNLVSIMRDKCDNDHLIEVEVAVKPIKKKTITVEYWFNVYPELDNITQKFMSEVYAKQMAKSHCIGTEHFKKTYEVEL